jgi:hypothetical protein
VPFIFYIVFGFQQQITRHTKKKQIQPKETNTAWVQGLDMAEILELSY